METTVQVVSESHTNSTRGIALPQLGYADGFIESGVDVYAWEDRIFVNDYNDVVVGAHFMDTTDALHTYRVELLSSHYWVFVDDQLVLEGVSPTVPSMLNGIRGGFGDSSTFSGGVSRWASVRLGSLADIGGPTVPEPAALVTVVLGLMSAAAHAATRRTRIEHL